MSLFDDEMDIDDGDEEGFNNTSLSHASDCLLSPQQSSYFIAHDDIEADMLSLWHSNRMPHALVFNGLKGIGKATFAYRLARFILKNSASENSADSLFGEEDNIPADTLAIPGDDPVFSRVASGGHTDMMVIGRPYDEKKGQYKNDIPVEEIRKIAPFLRKTSGNGGWRIVIVDDANVMNRNGQNALLKILEEPPKNALLILVTHGAGGLLPTIRSRCRYIDFHPLSHDHVAQLIRKSGDSHVMPADMDLISAMAEGSAGHAIDLLENGGTEAVTILMNALSSIEDLSIDQIDMLALSYGKSGDDQIIKQFSFILNWWFETLIYMAARGEHTKTIGNIDLNIPAHHTLQSLLSLHEAVDAHIKTCVNGNLDKRYMIFKTLRMIQGNK